MQLQGGEIRASDRAQGGGEIVNVWLRTADCIELLVMFADQQELIGTTSTTDCASSFSVRKNYQTRDP